MLLLVFFKLDNLITTQIIKTVLKFILNIKLLNVQQLNIAYISVYVIIARDIRVILVNGFMVKSFFILEIFSVLSWRVLDNSTDPHPIKCSNVPEEIPFVAAALSLPVICLGIYTTNNDLYYRLNTTYSYHCSLTTIY